ncbi:IS3 family transposase [Schnuerera ultunensis]
MTMFINKLNNKLFSKNYIYRLMKYLGISARIRRKKVNRIRIKPEYTIEYIKFYNEERLQKRLGCMAPLEYRYHASKSA